MGKTEKPLPQDCLGQEFFQIQTIKKDQIQKKTIQTIAFTKTQTKIKCPDFSI